MFNVEILPKCSELLIVFNEIQYKSVYFILIMEKKGNAVEGALAKISRGMYTTELNSPDPFLLLSKELNIGQKNSKSQTSTRGFS